MALKVLKPFNTVTQRMKPGADVTEEQVAPLDFEHLQNAGFIGPGEVVAPGERWRATDTVHDE